MLLMKNNQHCGSNINSDLHQAVSHHPLHYLCLISNPITWAGVYIIKRSRFVSLCNDLWTPLYSLCALVGSSTLEVNICCSLKSRFGRSNTVNLKHSLLIRSLVYFAGGKPSQPAKKNPLAFKPCWTATTCTAWGPNMKRACRWNRGYLNFSTLPKL